MQAPLGAINYIKKNFYKNNRLLLIQINNKTIDVLSDLQLIKPSKVNNSSKIEQSFFANKKIFYEILIVCLNFKIM